MIFLHELGHFMTAKAAGMKVTEFFIGFGPRVWSFQRGETEYGIKALPAGAYVKIIGMHNLDEFDPADADRTYMSKPFWRRLSVAVAGSAMHFLLAILGLFALFAFLGVPGGSVTEPRWVVGSGVEADTPAGEAGIEQGDRLVTVDGVDVSTFDDFRDVVAARPGETVAVVYERGGELHRVEVTLDRRHPETGRAGGFFGVGPALPPDQTVGVVDAVGETFSGFGGLVTGTVEGIGRILSPSGLTDLGTRVFGGESGPAVEDTGGRVPPRPSEEENDADRPVSILGVTQIGSDLLENDPSRFLELFVLLNVFIGVFNLVPLLPLDGGHVAIAVYEKIRSMFRGGEPYHVDVVKLLPLTYAVVMVLVFLGLSTVWLDIADPIGG
jgi:membrane-associated protease RseP (regulator of RpoE activity)